MKLATELASLKMCVAEYTSNFERCCLISSIVSEISQGALHSYLTTKLHLCGLDFKPIN